MSCLAPLSMKFPRQELQHALPFPSAGGLPNPAMEATAPALAGIFYPTEQGSCAGMEQKCQMMRKTTRVSQGRRSLCWKNVR